MTTRVSMTSSLTVTTRAKHRGFTLLEVMLGLALLAVGLVVLVKSAANSIFNTQQAHMMGVATDLARAKMYELEEKLIKDGFSDLEQHEDDQPLTEEGWPSIHYSYKIEPVELPGWDQLQALVKQTGCKGSASGSGSGSSGGSGSSSGSDGASDCGFENSALGGMMAQFGGGGGASGGKGSGDVGAAAGASFVQGQYQMFQQILKVSIRKVSLTLNWQVMGSDRDMKVVAFFTDAASMDKVINGMGSQDLDDLAGSGSGKQSGLGGGGRGSGSGSGK
jgi:prepilin-type N-terminal cleavage/methylation domain-containing protein